MIWMGHVLAIWQYSFFNRGEYCEGRERWDEATVPAAPLAGLRLPGRWVGGAWLSPVVRTPFPELREGAIAAAAGWPGPRGGAGCSLDASCVSVPLNARFGDEASTGQESEGQLLERERGSQDPAPGQAWLLPP